MSLNASDMLVWPMLREPYTVTNPRGWSYLYPPIFALSVAPLSGLDTVSQVVVWFAVSLACCFGVHAESCRLWRLIGARGQGSRPSACIQASPGHFPSGNHEPVGQL